MSTYPNPLPALSNLTLREIQPERKATLESREKVEVEIEYLESIGWSIELRYDLTAEAFKRQPFTGAQELLTRQNIAAETKDGTIRLRSKDSRLDIRASDGAISVLQGDATVLHTETSPFSYHPKPVKLYENLMSLKVTDLKERSPESFNGVTFDSHMLRFQYPKPGGLILGLPGQTGEINRNGYRFELYNTDTPVHNPSRPPMYQSWPILIHKGRDTTHWVAVFHDNPSRTFVDVGDFYPDLVTFESIAGNTRIYILTSDALTGLSGKISHLLGLPKLLPLWAFGYQQCRWSYMSTEEARQVAQTFRRLNISCDALYFDIDYMDGFRVFTNDKRNFPDLRECVEELHGEGFKAVCINDPGVKQEAGYFVYEEFLKEGGFLTDEKDEPFLMRCWAAESHLPDFQNPKTQRLWAELQCQWLKSYEFDGIWNDMNEPANFAGGNRATAKAFGKNGAITHEHNLYGYNMAKAASLGWQLAHPNKRGLNITRSGYPGVQQFSVAWHGDNHAWWEHLRLAIDTTIQYSLMGLHYTGADIPGFGGNPPDDLAVRFFQLGAFLPFFRGHSIYFAKDKEPYAFGEKANHLIKEAIKLRYSLLREWYSAFERGAALGHAPVLPVFDRDESLIRDEFLLFGKILVAPIVERDQKTRLVYLPEGDWYSWGDYANRIQGHAWISAPVSLSSTPLFVRAGSIIVRNQVGKNTAETINGSESYDLYLDQDGNAFGYWYGDDGISLQDPCAMRFRLEVVKGTSKVARLPV